MIEIESLEKRARFWRWQSDSAAVDRLRRGPAEVRRKEREGLEVLPHVPERAVDAAHGEERTWEKAAQLGQLV